MISFIIPFKSDDPHRILSYDRVSSHICEHFPNAEIISGGSEANWLRGQARNELAKQATGDFLFFLDADSFIPAKQLQAALTVAYSNGWCLPYDVYYNLSEQGTQAFYAGLLGKLHSSAAVLHKFPSLHDPEPAVGGCVVVAKDCFLGYDPRFQGWGEEDRAFVLALSTLVGPLKRVAGDLYHLWHPAPEDQRFGQPHFEENRALGNRYRFAHANETLMNNLVGEYSAMI